jgi:hypothetical protein
MSRRAGARQETPQEYDKAEKIPSAPVSKDAATEIGRTGASTSGTSDAVMGATSALSQREP